MEASITVSHSGSSPLTRGTLDSGNRHKRRLRFIPAYAGNSGDKSPCCLAVAVHPRLRGELSAVHPRLRGELSLLLIKKIDRNGSSPLTRGTHQLRPRSKRNRRFIPAYAGNSHASSRLSSLNSVHPRLRGELTKNPISRCIKSGSSPLTRGTPASHITKGDSTRFIPAYAGNSSLSVSSRHC